MNPHGVVANPHGVLINSRRVLKIASYLHVHAMPPTLYVAVKSNQGFIRFGMEVSMPASRIV